MILDLSDTKAWATLLGLADAPLFAKGEIADDDSHKILLDGGSGSFALSVLPDRNRLEAPVESWIWSADAGHHVGVFKDDVAVTRWDDPTAKRMFSRRSLESKLDAFYRFLVTDRITSSPSIVDHVVDLFRRVRGAVVYQTQRDDAAIHAFLFVLGVMSSNRGANAINDVDSIINEFALDITYSELLRRLDQRALRGIIEHYRLLRGGSRLLEMLPRLAIRHAGGLVFQEAHFELLRSGAPDLFGFGPAPRVKIDTRGGTHFTPPPLARTIVEQALLQLEPLSRRQSIKILDPACGSGAFLHETLRTLRRLQYEGSIELVGRDLSPHAVAMAKFVLRRAQHDWPEGQLTRIDIQASNSLKLDDPLPQADMIVMNPPFISWGGLTGVQRDEVKAVLGRLYIGQADYAMAFIMRAADSLHDGGVLGTLVPSSLLAAKTSRKWREYLVEHSDLSFLSVIGDHGLFPHALVQIAAFVLTKGRDRGGPTSYLSLWTNELRGVAGEAMRVLRRMSAEGTDRGASGEGWRVARDPISRLTEQADWRPRPHRLETILPTIRAIATTTVGDLFRVSEGVRTGLREAFILNSSEYASLPISEKRYFRPIAENKNIVDGRIMPGDYLFYPYSEGLCRIQDEADLRMKLPSFYESHLLPHRAKLVDRVAITRREAASKRRDGGT